MVNPKNVASTLKTLFNIVEAPLIFFFTLMSVLYGDVEIDQLNSQEYKSFCNLYLLLLLFFFFFF